MKISKVEPLHVGQFMFARVETDEGITGVGEAGIWGHIRTAGTAIERFAEYLVGKSPFPIEHHWNVMHRFSYFQGLAINAGISAIDIALWDIKGKALNVPLYQLFGGKAREHIELYATSGLPQGVTLNGQPPVGLKERAQATMAAGYRVYRVDSGILPTSGTGGAGGAAGGRAAAGRPLLFRSH